MFVVIITYTQPFEEIEKYLAAHRSFLDQGYQENYLLASGPQNPRTGGLILSQLKNRSQLVDFLANDPFLIQKVAEYNIIEFEPVKWHPDFKCFLE